MSIRRVSCALTFWSKDLSVEEMSEIARLAPDRSAEKYMTSWGAAVDRDSSFWELSSQSDPGASPDIHLGDLFKRVRTSWNELISLRERADSCQLSVAIHTGVSADRNPGLHLESDYVSVLASLGAEVDVEVYFEDD